MAFYAVFSALGALFCDFVVEGTVRAGQTLSIGLLEAGTLGTG